MGSFFIEFRDPLFSIIIFFSIVFAITFISYWWGRYRRKEDSKDIDKFVEQFRTLPSKNELQVLISSGALSQKSWLLLANAYYKNGDYEKAIEIYNEILQVSKETDTKKTMFLLGKTYFRAGFLERSKQIFLEILKKYPRTPEALHYLLLVHEQMKDYKSALEVLEPLDELGEDISLDREYLQALSILNDNKLSDEIKCEKLLVIYRENHNLIYMIFEYLFRVDQKLAWENLDHSKSEVLVQVLWNLNPKELNLDIISQSGYLRELYSARGDLNLAKSSSTFELDVLIKLDKKANATLSFEYVCSSCKGTYPFAFNRCSACHAIDSATIDIALTKDYIREFGEESNSFQ
ncbi:tetratricopeptide repeat protein [Sulfurimonas sp. C5]|uniref:tetratricopeptide repeat protein n=1 Tax=Sulfurimonas sp. C5 TaxID=3036947 RepID=UPI002456A977|nr:tetratricopeptide repeat protein [Sulfurimonas sp. C5]MDH4945429.1 tetratricopeptide repeat protein [Sulfurimonas sp. C5]